MAQLGPTVVRGTLNVLNTTTFKDVAVNGNIDASGVGTFDSIVAKNATISDTKPELILESSGGTSQINFTSSVHKDTSIIHKILDSEIISSDGNGQAFIVTQSGTTNATVGLEVEGEVYANVDKRVFHDGYHPNADKLTSERQITITQGGDLTGSASVLFDGSKAVSMTLNASVKDDSHNHIIANVDGLQTILTATASDITAIEGDIDTLQTSVSGIETEVSELQTSVSGIETEVSELQPSLNQIITMMRKMEGKVGCVRIYMANDIDDDYLPILGQTITKAQYPDYFAHLGITDNSLTLPDWSTHPYLHQASDAIPAGSTLEQQLLKHTHTASANSAGAHSHTIDNKDLGTKTVSTKDLGTKTTNTTGNHNHGMSLYKNQGIDQAVSSYGSRDYWKKVYTDSSGNHSHTVALGSHNHTVAMGAHDHTMQSAGDHSHTITVNENGADLLRPNSTAVVFAVKVKYSVSVPNIGPTPSLKKRVEEGMTVNRLDANGNQNVMVKIPVMANKVFNDALGTSWMPEEAPHPAFIRPDGTTMPWFEFGMYQASNDGNGNPVSAPHKDPYVYVDFDDAKAKCQAMGVGWGMTSNAQWAAIALWCLANGYQPLGNTYYGYSHERSYLGGIRQDGGINGDASGSAQILTGSGPVEFRHNKIMQGISDMVGNTWEWVDGLKSVGGQIFVATRERQDEAEWEAQAAYLDDGLKLNSELTDITSANVTWSSLGKSETYIANQLLQQLMIEPITETGEALGRLYYNNDGERIPRRGGRWNNGSNAGLGALSLSNERSNRNSNNGFRPAYFE